MQKDNLLLNKLFICWTDLR